MYTANLRTNIMDFRGFDSSTILIIRGAILMSIGISRKVRVKQILVGMILVGRLGVNDFCVLSLELDSRNRTEAGEPNRTVLFGTGTNRTLSRSEAKRSEAKRIDEITIKSETQSNDSPQGARI